MARGGGTVPSEAAKGEAKVCPYARRERGQRGTGAGWRAAGTVEGRPSAGLASPSAVRVLVRRRPAVGPAVRAPERCQGCQDNRLGILHTAIKEEGMVVERNVLTGKCCFCLPPQKPWVGSEKTFPISQKSGGSAEEEIGRK